MIDKGVIANAPDLISISKTMTMRQSDAIAQACDQERPLLPSTIHSDAGNHVATKSWINDRLVSPSSRT